MSHRILNKGKRNQLHIIEEGKRITVMTNKEYSAHKERKRMKKDFMVISLMFACYVISFLIICYVLIKNFKH